MANENLVVLQGNLTRDCELKQIGSDGCVVNCAIAINRHYTKADGEQVKEATFVDLEAWGAIAEALAKRGRTGDILYVRGRLKQDTWEKDGEKRSKLKVSIERFSVFPKPQKIEDNFDE